MGTGGSFLNMRSSSRNQRPASSYKPQRKLTGRSFSLTRGRRTDPRQLLRNGVRQGTAGVLNDLSAPTDTGRPGLGPLDQLKESQSNDKQRNAARSRDGMTEPKLKRFSRPEDEDSSPPKSPDIRERELKRARFKRDHQEVLELSDHDDEGNGDQGSSESIAPSSMSEESSPQTSHAVCSRGKTEKKKKERKSSPDFASDISWSFSESEPSAPKQESRQSGAEAKKAAQQCEDEPYEPHSPGEAMPQRAKRQTRDSKLSTQSTLDGLRGVFKVTKRNNPKSKSPSIGETVQSSLPTKRSRNKRTDTSAWDNRLSRVETPQKKAPTAKGKKKKPARVVPGASLVESPRRDSSSSDGKRKSKRRKIACLAPPETITIESSDDENDDAPHTFQLVRIAFGSDVQSGDCEAEVSADGHILSLSHRRQVRKTRSGSSGEKKNYSSVSTDLSDIKYFMRSDESVFERDEDELPSFVAFLTCGTLFADICKDYRSFKKDDRVVLEFRQSHDLDLFRSDRPFALSELESEEAKDMYIFAFKGEDEKEERHKRKSTTDVLNSEFLRGKEEDDILVVYPFSAEQSEMVQASMGLLELSLENLKEGSTTEEKLGGRGHYLTVRVNDYLRLEAAEYLNDTLIDFWMQFISQGDNSSTHFFSTHFYSTLAEKGPKGVKNWTVKRNINVFEKRLIFLPINKSLHWSLAVILNPASVGSTAEGDGHCCILFFDSLRAHSKQTVAVKIRHWLNSEWARIHDTDEEKPFDSFSMKVHAPRVPYQDNGWDCGVFVCKYAYALYQMRGKPFSNKQIDPDNVSSSLRTLITEHELFRFDGEDIENIRRNMRTLIERLTPKYYSFLCREKKRSRQKKVGPEIPSEEGSSKAPVYPDSPEIRICVDGDLDCSDQPEHSSDKENDINLAVARPAPELDERSNLENSAAAAAEQNGVMTPDYAATKPADETVVISEGVEHRATNEGDQGAIDFKDGTPLTSENVENGVSNQGGGRAIDFEDGTPLMIEGLENRADTQGDGGAIDLKDSTSLTSEGVENKADTQGDGRAIDLKDSTSLTSEGVENKADTQGDGGAIDLKDSTSLTSEGVENRADTQGDGGVIDLKDSTSLTSEGVENRADTQGDGGVIDLKDSTSLTNEGVENRADTQGDGGVIDLKDSTSLTNEGVENRADTQGDGGGATVLEDGTLYSTFCDAEQGSEECASTDDAQSNVQSVEKTSDTNGLISEEVSHISHQEATPTEPRCPENEPGKNFAKPQKESPDCDPSLMADLRGESDGTEVAKQASPDKPSDDSSLTHCKSGGTSDTAPSGNKPSPNRQSRISQYRADSDSQSVSGTQPHPPPKSPSKCSEVEELSREEYSRLLNSTAKARPATVEQNDVHSTRENSNINNQSEKEIIEIDLEEEHCGTGTPSPLHGRPESGRAASTTKRRRKKRGEPKTDTTPTSTTGVHTPEAKSTQRKTRSSKRGGPSTPQPDSPTAIGLFDV